jgi:hypothetical protein
VNRTRFAARFLVATAISSGAQTLTLPDRDSNSPAGSQFARQIETASLADRDAEIFQAVGSGNAPSFLRHLVPVTIVESSDGQTNSATFYVTPDYLSVGSDDDYFLTPLTPMTAQRLADQLDCSLPTRKMVDAIYRAAPLKLAPSPIPPSAAMTTVPVFAAHNAIVRMQRLAVANTYPLGTLVAGHKKDVVLSARLTDAPDKVAIYGWQQTNGAPIQPLYLGHAATWVDYSHGIRLVQHRMTVNGETTTVAQVLADPRLAGLLSYEGVVSNAFYSTNRISLAPKRGEGSRVRGETDQASFAPNIGEFKPTGHFGERVAVFPYVPEVKVQINAPALADFAPGKPVLLILYALPNGNTIEQTVGKQLQPGDDRHFDIQHIGAQTRFLRAQHTNQTIVVAYLEAEMKSWPAWRRKHGDAVIPAIIDRVKTMIRGHEPRLVLTGHSGGGSFTFGYLNTVEEIPDSVERIAFLDSNYAYEATNHLAKLTNWLSASPQHALSVLAYHDSIALLDGKTFVSERGGTWGRSHAMLDDLGTPFPFTSRTNHGLETYVALDGRLQFLLLENPDRKILHTIQVERNGFIHALLTGATNEGNGYEYLGDRAYTNWIQLR